MKFLFVSVFVCGNDARGWVSRFCHCQDPDDAVEHREGLGVLLWDHLEVDSGDIVAIDTARRIGFDTSVSDLVFLRFVLLTFFLLRGCLGLDFLVFGRICSYLGPVQLWIERRIAMVVAHRA